MSVQSEILVKRGAEYSRTWKHLEDKCFTVVHPGGSTFLAITDFRFPAPRVNKYLVYHTSKRSRE